MLPQLYHAHLNRHLEDIPFWLELAAQTADPILELGCGTGRVLIPMARAGYQTLGMDRDRSMLKIIQGSLGQIEPVPWLVEADIRRFKLARQFSLIILPCNTLSTLNENGRMSCLGCTKEHMRPGGNFATSVPNPEILMSVARRSEPEMEDEFTHPQTGNPVQVSSGWQRIKRSFKVTWIYDHLLPNGSVDRQTAEVIHQIVPASKYTEEIQSAGMKLVGTYGDFDRSVYYSDSPYLIFVATI